MPRGRRHAGLLAVAVALTGADAVAAQEPRGWTAPSYPGNTLTLSHAGPFVAGNVVRVQMAGHAEWNETPTRASTTPYDLSMYVQNPDVEPDCAQSYRAQQQTSSNLDIGAASGSSWVMTSDLYISPEPPASGIDWSIESVPFVVRPGLDRVLLCAYQRYVLDDAAGYQLPVAVEQPRCRPTRRTVRRGARLALRCNVTGAISVQFHGRRRSRDATGRIDGESGTATVSTRGLRRGRYRVKVYAGSLQLGSTFRIRVR